MAGDGGTASLEPLAGEVVASLLPGDRIDGVYRVERLLGQGGGGAVYLVRHEGLDGARFALKVLHPHPGRPAELLAREGRLAAGVRSAHVVKVAALGRLPGGAPYLVMEYVEGPTLEALLAEGELSRALALDCVHQLCLALEAAHDAGLVHGDVSLRNVFATPTPDGKLHMQLGDFGLARRVQRNRAETISLELGSGRGTPRFMSPEAIAGDAVDERSDLFAAGVIAYRLLAGRFPFEGDSAREILAAVLRGTPVRLVEYRRDAATLDAVVMRCLAPDPKDRFASARDLRSALLAAAAAGPAQPPPRRRRFAGAPRRITAAAGAVAVLGWLGVESWRARARLTDVVALECPDTRIESGDLEPDLARSIATAMCARLGADLDVDWGGGPNATRIETRLHAEPNGGWRLDVEADGRTLTTLGETPRAVALAAAQEVSARTDAAAPDGDEIRRWGALDAGSAADVRRLFRSRTALVYAELEHKTTAVLERDPGSPFAELLLAEIVRDPDRQAAAIAAAIAHADRLPPARAEAVRGFAQVLATPESADAAIEQLRRAYGVSPDDLDVGVLYAGALVMVGRAETARAVGERLHARFPRRGALVAHYLSLLPDAAPDSSARAVGWLVDALPEQRFATPNICLLTGMGQIAEADAALTLGRRFGAPDVGPSVAEAVVALAVGDPGRIDRATMGQEGATQSWSQLVGARMRLAGLLLRGQLAAAGTFASTQRAARLTAGDRLGALLYAVERLRLSRWAGGPTLGEPELAQLEATLTQDRLPLAALASAHTELALARLEARGATPGSAAAREALAAVDLALARAAGADSLALGGARLRTLPLAGFAGGGAEVAARWRAGETASYSERVHAAYDAARSLEGAGDAAGAEAAYRLAMSPYDIDRHPFESIAARIRLADLLEVAGRGDEVGVLRSHVDLAWSGADPELREAVRRGPG